jgi:Concanavalin A-like lectin/glucanases superfamily
MTSNARHMRSLFLSLFVMAPAILVPWLGGVTAGAAFAPSPQSACVTDPVVTSGLDSGHGSLREALMTACDGSTIIFAATVVGPITLSSTELLIDQNLTIQGPGANALIISGNGVMRVFNIGTVKSDVNVTLSGLTIANGRAPDHQQEGGGIFNHSTGTLNIVNSVLSGNSVTGQIEGFGGGIFNAVGTLNITNSTLSANFATSFGNPQGGSSGGAIFNQGTLNITNSTLSGNFVNGVGGAGAGGAILNQLRGAVTITNSTLSGNSASSSMAGNVNGGRSNGGAIRNDDRALITGTVKVTNSLIAGNTLSGDRLAGPDVSGAFISQGYNLIGDGSDSTGFADAVNHDQVGPRNGRPLAPLLDPKGLQANGGPTPTIALLPGSPAIDQGSAANDPATGMPITTDQRGFARPADDPQTPNAPGGNGSDVGAFELGAHASACVPPPNTTMVAWYPFDEVTGTLSANRATGNTGVQINGPTPIPGMVAGALRFDGVSTYVESPSSIVTNIGPVELAETCSGNDSSCRGNFSIDTWIRVDPSGSGTLTILDKRSGTPPAINGYHLFVLEGSLGLQLADGVGSGFSNYLSPSLTPALTDNSWHHIAVTVRRTGHAGIRWYHNGILVGINDPTDRLGSLENSSSLRIGTRTAAPPLSGWFLGDLDELEIYNRVLTPQEVAGIFSAGTFGKCK